MKRPRAFAYLVWLALAGPQAYPQTQVDLRTQSKSVDFAGASSTRPLKVGPGLPATCQPGEMYFRTDAPAGSNLYGCTSSDVWSLEAGGGGGGGSLPDMTNQANKVLATDGFVALWRSITTGPTGALQVTHSAGDIALDIVTAVLPQKSAANTFTGLNTFTPGLQLGETATPASPADGRMWYDASTKTFRCRQNGTTYDCIGSGGGGMTPSSVDTLTNKTIDAEATGNVITLTHYMQFQAANCQGGTAALGFATTASSAPAAACVSGTNTVYGVAQFADTATQSVQGNFALPPDWTGNIDFDLRWRANTTTGNVVWQIQTACAAEGETGDPSWNSPQTITDASKSTAYQFNDAVLAGALTVTGCAAGEQLFFKFLRDPAHASDNLSATAELLWIRFKLRRAE